ncbi:Hsp70 family protein [Pseudonocardia acaciae]|uniref:Hsp70 family protein n=1 Tax=Pseudonocardia acaciae TaxID=551276 RepID=UPI00048B96AB|nr:Hsp70 family protein [Pseudonocardia acaciae]
MAYNLGVDLGTTFVAAAIAHSTQVEMFTLGDRSVVAPAVVYVRDDGELVTGDAAGRRSVSNPDRVGREFKRRLGDPTPVMLGGAPHAVTALLGSLLRDVIGKITATEGQPPEHVVLTHPANWGPFRRGLFEEVPHLAGLPEVTLVTEPEAAAAHYAASRDLDEGEVIAVYDLGGGTFDATVLRKRAGGVEILGTPEGIERLGGVDFDEAILAHVNVSAGGTLSELDLTDPQTTIALARLRQDCILAKEALSVDTEAVLPVFLPGRHFDVKLTRAEFEDMVRAPIESTIGALSRTLRSAQVTPDDLSAVLLVGGSSRIPLVARMVSEELGRPTVVDTHPKYAVALGAATLAGAPETNGHAATVPAVETAPATGGREPESVAAGSAPPRTRPSDGKAASAAPAAAFAPVTAPAPRTNDRPLPAVPAPREPVVPPRDDRPSAPPPHGQPPPARARPPAIARAARSGSPRWQLIGLGVLAVVAAVAVVLATVLVINSVKSGPSEAAAGDAVTNTPALAPPTQAQAAPSVPVPSLGTPIQVGATPTFVAVSPNGRLAYVANGAAKIVTVVDTSINKVIATIPVEAGPPQYVTFAPDGRKVYLSIFNEARTIAQVGVLDTTTNRIVATIPVRTRPFLAAVTADGRWLYVPNHDSGTVSVIDTANNTVAREIKVPANPHWIEFSKDGTRAYTANHESNLIAVLDTATGAVTAQIPVQTSPHSLAVHPNRPLLANVNYDSNSVTVIDTNTNKVTATIPVGKNPREISWAPDGRFAYVANETDGTVSVINIETNQVTATIPTGPAPSSIGVLPNGQQAYVTNQAGTTLAVLDIGA